MRDTTVIMECHRASSYKANLCGKQEVSCQVKIKMRSNFISRAPSKFNSDNLLQVLTCKLCHAMYISNSFYVIKIMAVLAPRRSTKIT